MNTDTGQTSLATSLLADPFSSLAVHYGMLLGVTDFQVLMGNARGKQRLHQAWQHGPGVVWGYPVAAKPDSAEVSVGPGLAVDGVGREVSLGVEHCVDVSKWLAEHDDVKPAADGSFNLRVVLRYRACLARPVPAMSSGCDAGTNDTAYSRVLETGELLLVPYGNDAEGHPAPPPDDRGAAFARLRALVREGRLPDDAADPADPAATDMLHAFRILASRETRELAPPSYSSGSSAAGSSRLYPENEPADVVLGDLPGLKIVDTRNGPRLEAGPIDQSIRRAHLPTWLIEELIGELASSGAMAVPDAGGPRVTGITRAASTVTVTLSSDIVEGTIAGALSVHAFDTADASPSWTAASVTTTYTPSAAGPPATPATIAVDLPNEPTVTRTFRLVLRGTGEIPLVAVVNGRPVPLAGRSGGAAGGAAAGHDVTDLLT